MQYLMISKIAQIFIVVPLTLLILMQSKGGGLTMSVGNTFSMYRSKRGFEKAVFISTIIFSVLLVINSLLIVLLS